MMKSVFEQCLCCLLHHSEVWMSFARFTLQVSGGYIEARTLYREAIEIIPDVVSLRLALAELEESQGSKESSKIVLKTAFEKIPCAYTFSALQRFIRRKDGITAARKLYSDTLSVRRDPTKESLGLEVCTVRASKRTFHFFCFYLFYFLFLIFNFFCMMHLYCFLCFTASIDNYKHKHFCMLFRGLGLGC